MTFPKIVTERWIKIRDILIEYTAFIEGVMKNSE